jgi:hypothetical protein
MAAPAAASPPSSASAGAKARDSPGASNPGLSEDFTPEDLAGHLLDRLDGDETAVATFLLQAVSALPNASSISEQLCKDAPAADGSGELGSRADAPVVLGGGGGGGEVASATTAVSLTNPRGKFALELYERGLKLVDAKDNAIVVKRGAVRHAVVFPKPEDMIRAKHQLGGGGAASGRKDPPLTMFLLLVFRRGAGSLYKNKPLPQICCQLPTSAVTAPAGSGGGGSSGDGPAPWSAFLAAVCQQLGVDGVVRVARRSELFRSHSEEGTSTTTSGMPFVSCYHGVNDGVLFPLPEGLLFFKPPMFVPADSIHSLAVGRRNSSGGRYIDLSVVTAGDDDDDVGASGEGHRSTIEFTNIHKDEATGLNSYIQSLVDERGNDNEPVEGAGRSSSPPGQSRRSGRPPARRAGIAARNACRRNPAPAAGDDTEDDEDEDGDYETAAKIRGSASEGGGSDDDETRGDDSEAESEAEVDVDEEATEDDEATESEHDDADGDEEENPHKRRRQG